MRVFRARGFLWLAAAAGGLTAGPSTAQAPPVVVADHPPILGPAAASSLLVAAQDGRTWVYFLNGADPLGNAGLARVAERVRRSGYPRTRYGEMYDVFAFESEIREVHARDPHARFALIGFSFATLEVRTVAKRLLRDGIPVAMLGYIGGDYLSDREVTRPAGVAQVVNVTGDGFLLTGRNLFWNGVAVSGATNVELPGVSHFGLPTHPKTYAALREALARVSAGP